MQWIFGVKLKVEGFPRSWYPISRSCDLKRGRSLSIRAFAKDWVLFRGANGEVGCLSRHCTHMGADLSQGAVCGDVIECPLHGWRFGPTGLCEHIPSLDELPGEIRSGYLPCEERFGMIFVFWGEKAEYDLPSPPGMEGGEPVNSRAYDIDLESAHHTPCLNTFDLQHFERIHNRQFLRQPQISSRNSQHLQIEYEAKIITRRWSDYVMSWIGSSTTRVVIDCWGSSLLMLLNRDTGIGGMVAMLPVEHTNCRVFILAMKPGRGDSRQVTRVLDKMAVSIGAILMKGFLYPDLAALTNMRPYQGRWVDGLDDTARQYWDYWRQLPRWSGASAAEED